MTNGGDDFRSKIQSLGLDLDDPELSEAVWVGLQRVEDLMHHEIQDEFSFVTEASLHLVDAGGKRFRPLVVLLTSQLGTGINDDVIKAGAVVELVHLATLYHDDVMDEATMRRGAESANARWDNTVAILTGDFLFSHACRLAAELGTEAGSILARTFTELVTGQLRETIGAQQDTDPVEHYLKVIAEKTGSLIATAGRFGAMFSGVPEEQELAVRRFGDVIGTAFQIADDIIDIASATEESGKTPGTDLREGVRTLPMLYALAGDDDSAEARRLRELLAGPITDDALVDEALRLLRESPALGQARKTLDEYADRARAELDLLPASTVKAAFTSLVDYVVERVR